MMDAIYTDITQELADKVTTNAKKYKNRLPFKHHARDYIIGTTAQVNIRDSRKRCNITNNGKRG